jgi:hypothetical protein
MSMPTQASTVLSVTVDKIHPTPWTYVGLGFLQAEVRTRQSGTFCFKKSGGGRRGRDLVCRSLHVCAAACVMTSDTSTVDWNGKGASPLSKRFLSVVAAVGQVMLFPRYQCRDYYLLEGLLIYLSTRRKPPSPIQRPRPSPPGVGRSWQTPPWHETRFPLGSFAGQGRAWVWLIASACRWIAPAMWPNPNTAQDPWDVSSGLNTAFFLFPRFPYVRK